MDMTPGRKKTPGVPYIKTEKGFPYYYVTYAPGKRKTLHRLNWEKENGPIPPNHVIRFRDQNTLNCAIENLELIHHREIAARIPKENQSAGMRRMYETKEGKAMVARRSAKFKKTWNEGRFPTVQRTEKIRQMILAGQIQNPITRMDDAIVAYWLFPYKPEMAAYVLANHPELIVAKRQQTLLKRALKAHENTD